MLHLYFLQYSIQWYGKKNQGAIYGNFRQELGCYINFRIFLPVHRFYVGKIGTGILYLITFGGFGIWYIIDIVMIILDKFTDKEGRKLKK